MASEIQIINLALGALGANRINGRLDDCKEAREMNACFDHVRDAELRARTWRFSLARASLSALVSVPAFQFDNEFLLPVDCLRVVQVGDFYAASLSDARSSDESPFSVEGRKILTSLSAPLNVRYVQKQTADDAQGFDACFVLVLALSCALFTCKAITGSSSEKDRLLEEYRLRVNEALWANAIEVPPAAVPDDSWILARSS